LVRCAIRDCGLFRDAGSGEAREGKGPYRDKTGRFGETSADAIAEKMRFVIAQMENSDGATGRRLGDDYGGPGLQGARCPPQPRGGYRGEWRGLPRHYLAFLPAARDGIPARSARVRNGLPGGI
jgi:hypothetical protein